MKRSIEILKDELIKVESRIENINNLIDECNSKLVTYLGCLEVDRKIENDIKQAIECLEERL